MPGFGFTVQYERATLELMRRLLRHTQRQGHYFGLEVRYRKRPVWEEYLVEVDGPLRGMQALSTRLWIELPLLAEWHDAPKPTWRRTDAAYDLLEGYADGVGDMTRSALHLRRTLRRLTLPEYADVAYFPESIVFDEDSIPTHLVAPLRTFEAVLALFQNLPENAAMVWPPMRIEVELVVEEAHTAVELLLRNALGTRSQSFAQMAEVAFSRGWINRGQRDSLVDLKNLRKRVKHHGQDAGLLSNAYTLVMNAAACCHLLLEQIAVGQAAAP